MSPLYSYKAVSSDGKPLRGLKEAKSLGLARSALRDEGLLVLEVIPRDQPSRPRPARRLRRVTARGVFSTTRHLGVLLRGGVPLTEALESIIATTEERSLRQVLRETREAILQGKSLSDALESYPTCFDQIFIAMVRSGEAGGRLDRSLLDLAALLDKRRQMRSRIITALTYPAVTFFFGLAIVIFLLTFVIPQITETLLSQQKALPFATEVLLASSELVRTNALLLAALFVTMLLGLRVVCASRKGRIVLEALVLRTPALGHHVKKQVIARFTTVLGSLLRAGIPLLDSLQLARGTLGNRLYSIDLDRVHTEVLEGVDLSRALAASPLYPPTLPQLIAVGEKSGELDSQLLDLGRTLEEEVNTSMQRLADLLGPVVTVVLGLLVAFVMAAIISPLADFGDF